MNGNPGCLSEQSFEMRPDQRASLDASISGRGGVTTRQWLATAHRDLDHLLPPKSAPALLTEDLVDSDGKPVDVYAHFGLQPGRLRSLMGNFRGIQCTAQCASQDYAIDTPAPGWPGFDDVWIPIEPRLSLAGRLGLARRGKTIIDADCIVILPGFFGDNGVTRTRDMALFLRDAGYHVLALEIRGHGQTEARYPDMTHTFGVMETDDLMLVSDWLTDNPHIRRTGLIGYCWGANIALLAAWYEAHRDDDPGICSAIKPYLHATFDRRRFQAGIIAYSPILRWEVMMEDLKTPRSYLSDPVYSSIQQMVRDRMERKHYASPGGNLRRLIEAEYLAQDARLPGGAKDGFPFIRLMPFGDEPWYDKLATARVPVLIVHGADDPLSPAQNVADFVSMVHNPNLAAIILPGGGHVGFAAYCKAYYYSLIAGFFDPLAGAAGTGRSQVVQRNRQAASG